MTIIYRRCVDGYHTQQKERRPVGPVVVVVVVVLVFLTILPRKHYFRRQLQQQLHL
jgi:hypothetical protein